MQHPNRIFSNQQPLVTAPELFDMQKDFLTSKGITLVEDAKTGNCLLYDRRKRFMGTITLRRVPHAGNDATHSLRVVYDYVPFFQSKLPTNRFQ